MTKLEVMDRYGITQYAIDKRAERYEWRQLQYDPTKEIIRIENKEVTLNKIEDSSLSDAEIEENTTKYMRQANMYEHETRRNIMQAMTRLSANVDKATTPPENMEILLLLIKTMGSDAFISAKTQSAVNIQINNEQKKTPLDEGESLENIKNIAIPLSRGRKSEKI